MIHRTTVQMDISTDTLYRRMIEAVISLYRRSQMAGENGRLFIMRRMFNPFEQEIGLIRTDDEQVISSILTGRELFHDDIRELDESEILQLHELLHRLSLWLDTH